MRTRWVGVLVLCAACGEGSPQRVDATNDDAPRDGGSDAPLDATVIALAQQAYIKASNTGIDDNLGSLNGVALSADGSTLAVGAVGEDSAALGVGGDQASNAATDSGAVYLLVRTGTTWSQQAYLKASDAALYFGYSVALSADGSTLAVGAMGSSTVYVFARAGTTWSQQGYLQASNRVNQVGSRFGRSLTLSADGATLAIGANGESSAATGVGGDQADASANGSGAVYVFSRTGTRNRTEIDPVALI